MPFDVILSDSEESMESAKEMFCLKARKLIIPYSEGALDDRTAGVVARHIASCPRCAEELFCVEKTGAVIRGAKTPAQEPASDLWTRIEREIAAPVPAPVQVGRQWRVRGLHLAGAAAAAAVVLLVVLTDTSLIDRHEPRRSPVTKQVAVPRSGVPGPDSRPRLGVSKSTDATLVESIGKGSTPFDRLRRVRPWKRPAATTIDSIGKAVPPTVSDDSVTDEFVDGHVSLAPPAPPAGTVVASARDNSLYVLGASAPGAPGPAFDSGAPAGSAPIAAAEAPRRVERASENTTSVDLLNNADTGSRVSALFSYP